MAELRTAGTLTGISAARRRDLWWLQPLLVFLGLGIFIVYATYRGLAGDFYAWGPYLSPFYSPLIDPRHHWWPYSPALLILIGPLGFRTTCYYYRKAYYRAFFWDPPACAVGELRHGYQGESSFPLILQNVHRYFFYISFIYLVSLWFDAVHGFIWDGRFGMGLGSLVLLLNAALLSLYTFSCHSCRHFVGGNLDCFSCAKFGGGRLGIWRKVTFLNERHMQIAWTSLFWVGFSDLYVRLISSGAFHDPRFF
ncbi:MAG TPA: hypothetical protein VJN21_03440 [Candidatus Acidoferrales bacterium]|nr:hypothetical protein [Candidatus Acidoferrales bacterium]